MRKLVMILVMVAVGLAVLPTTLLLGVGMMPTIAAFFVDKTKQQLKAMTVGCLNFSGCFYYWLQLVSPEHTLDKAWELITPTSMSVMYAGAAAGYIVEWGVSTAVAVLMVQQGKTKLKSIRRKKEAMVDRWGVEVTGNYRLDEFGFPVANDDK